MLMFRAIWTVAAVGIVVAVAILRAWRSTTVGRLDVGSVSDQWVAHHRVESGQRSTR